MNIIEQRVLRGPNLYSSAPCLLTMIDLAELQGVSTSALPDFNDALLALLPSLAQHYSPPGKPGGFVQRLQQGTYMARVVEHVTLELQTLAGTPAGFGRSAPIDGEPGRYRVVCGYQFEQVGQQAFALAMELVTTLAHGSPFSLEEPLDDLRDHAARLAIGASTAAVIDAATRRGIPSLRLTDEADLFQLGWGQLQQHLPASDAGAGACAGDAIVEAMYGDSNGRIPVIAVTGTNGKTTTSLLLAHAARLAHKTTGLTTTEGVFIGDARIDDGDCSGYWSARKVLTSPVVDFAVLETARGGILKRGLAFDRCEVGVVLNVSADHLGMDGVETLADLAEVKAVVARSASRAVVLNAEDPYCVRMASQVEEDVEVLYFSLDPEHPVLLTHIDQRGRAVYLQDGVLMVADRERRVPLIAAAAMPISVQGHAMFNIANALAATAALIACDFSRRQIAAALSSFVSNSHTNPLRANIYQLGHVTLVVDYAHNAAAYRALGKMARSLAKGKVIGVVTAPGDRRDADLRDVGRHCAVDFNELIVYQSNPRGRADGATGALIVEGIRQQLRRDGTAVQIDDVQQALQLAIAKCQPGDVLVFSSPSTPHVLVEALRGLYPEHAARIAADLHGVCVNS